MLPSPNHRMNTGTQASDGIGISALVSGRKKFSTGRKRPIRMPSGRPTTTASAKPMQHPVERVERMPQHGAVGAAGRRACSRPWAASAAGRAETRRCARSPRRARPRPGWRRRRAGSSGMRSAVMTVIIPQRTTVYCSSRWNTSFSSASPMMPITAMPASITSVLRNSRAPKMSQPSPHGTAASSSTTDQDAPGLRQPEPQAGQDVGQRARQDHVAEQAAGCRRPSPARSAPRFP